LNTYEALFIFSGSIKEEPLKQILEKVSAEIVKLGGSVQSRASLGRRPFARPMKRREAGNYVKVRFTSEPGAIEAFQSRFRLNEDIFRLQIVRAAAPPPQEKRASEPSNQEETTNGQS